MSAPSRHQKKPDRCSAEQDLRAMWLVRNSTIGTQGLEHVQRGGVQQEHSAT